MKKEFYVQLDGLRALAVIAVMIMHWIFFGFIQNLSLGFWGVNLFFVLSGFLITEILLKQINTGKKRRQILKSFYIKRSLRIFPIYYLVIIGAFILHLDNSQNLLGYTVTYTLNFYNSFSGNEGYMLTHIWSLCVEEQFYLIWPFLLLVVKPKHHLVLIFAIIFIALGFRLLLYLLHLHNYKIYDYRMMPACLDALGLGALLAYLKLYKQGILHQILRLSFIPLLCLSLYLFLKLKPLPVLDGMTEVVMRFCISVCCFFIIGNAVFEYKNWFGKFLQSSGMRYLGKISYGLYLYHLLVSTLLSVWLNKLLYHALIAFLPKMLVYNLFLITAPIYLLLTIAIASLSYYYIEKPFLKRKDRIDYHLLPVKNPVIPIPKAIGVNPIQYKE